MANEESLLGSGGGDPFCSRLRFYKHDAQWRERTASRGKKRGERGRLVGGGTVVAPRGVPFSGKSAVLDEENDSRATQIGRASCRERV